MTKSDSLDNITLDSDDMKTIERFENNYYNHKKNLLQNGGTNSSTNKLNKNIVRLFNYYVLSTNKNGRDSDLTSRIKNKLNKKITELNN